jgi:predicted DNA-binding transcriptional regulator YafY
MSERGSYERFFWFDREVRTGKYPNASTLADRFEVSRKTAQRDIEFMRDRLNAPLEYDQIKKGYLYSNSAFYLPFTYLSSRELSALLIARQMLKSIAGETLKEELSAAIHKITAILGKSMEKTDSIDEFISFELIQHSPVSQEIFAGVLEACLHSRCIHFDYYSPAQDKETSRTAEPYHLFNYNGTWHLIAYCRDRKNIRDFVLARMKNIKILNESFRTKKDFDPQSYLQSAFGIFKGKPDKEVTLRFTPKKSKWIKEQVWYNDQKIRTLKDGSIELAFPVVSYYEVIMDILRHGAEVEVVKPKALRVLIKEEALKILKIYDK